ncbi:hypothetical protein LUZ62_074797 [Rhynchospora pubera]|uniref:non-specific serine/threonine protein kinase n=1 Tax=Rhynchospora pubera TaxID=906938 RepID=A0AAV8D7G9_9POAL|nr:hypothetical protein LUZ62_074797 [Rhynchospora pubera]
MNSAIHLASILISLSIVLCSITNVRGGYKPSDSILLSCGGGSDGNDADGRKWVMDTNSKFLAGSVKSTVVTADYQDPALPSPVPYMSARVFTAPATYSISVNKVDRHWMRLHFYPATYPGFSPDSAYFSVSASGGFTLLSNFSAHVTAKALSLAYVVKEFSLPASEDGIISLTFTPSDKYKGSYAFINGIEIVSMPDLFSQPASLVGFSDQTLEIGGVGLQTMYRLNVGGQYVAPSNDSGMSRTWYDDSAYLYGAAFGVTNEATDKVKVDYPDAEAEYIAPTDVYSTTRTMGPDPTINRNYNLTWVFSVDGNYTYVVRFHFCELIHTKVNQRVFDIYVNNRTAYEDADVIAWASSKAVPVYKDFAISVTDGPGDDQLWVALHPSVDAKPQYYDSILNGLEIFKMSSSTGNLAGPNPEPSEMLLKAEANLTAGSFKTEPRSSSVKILAPVGGVVAAAVVIAVVAVLYKKKGRMPGNDSNGMWLPLYGHSHTSSNSKSSISGKSSAGSNFANVSAICRHFSFAEIKQATKNFDESLVIGVGGFGKVYKGVVDGVKVAIKRSNPQSEQGVNEFNTEIEMLSKLRHKHLVSLIGFCEEDEEMCLVYDHMAHGTLREHLYKTNNTPLQWKPRLEICIGAARGLHYLHTGAKYTIIHRDVKTTNILLDEKWVAKVSDFGLSKTGPTMNQGHVSTMVKGSFGYLDPEYFKRQQLTEKSDVYSFGVVLFEVLCARPALNPSLPRDQMNLSEWAMNSLKKGALNDIIDPVVKNQIAPECLKKFVYTAEKCLLEHGVDRPSMGDVLWNLEFALQLQETFENGGSPSADGADASGSFASSSDSVSLTSDETGVSRGIDDPAQMSTTAVFSQIVHPSGR